MIIDLELKEWGNSYGIRISKEVAKQAGVKNGDTVSIDMIKKKKDGFGIFKGPIFKRERQDRY